MFACVCECVCVCVRVFMKCLFFQNVKKRCQRLRMEAKAVGGLKKCRVCLTSDHSKRCAGPHPMIFKC